MKKLLWISIALALTGCGKQAQAETTVTPTTTEIETTAETTTVAETTNVEETQNQDMMNVIRQEVIDGDIKGLEIDEEVDMWCDFLSDTEKAEFKSELHLLEAKEAEVVPETTKSQPQETKSQTSNQNQPKETQAKPAPQPTQSTEAPQQTEPQVTEVYQEPAPTPQPTQPQNNNTSGEIDTSGWNIGGGATIEQRPLDENQNLSPGELADIESVDFN